MGAGVVIAAIYAVAMLVLGLVLGYAARQLFDPTPCAEHWRAHFEDGYARGWLDRDWQGRQHLEEQRIARPPDDDGP